MDLEKLDRFLPKLAIALGVIVISMVTIAITDRSYYYTLQAPIIGSSIITLATCIVGYVVNKKYLKSDN